MEIRDIPVGSIVPNPNNPRKEWEGIDDLARSIARFGLWQPLVVVEDGGAYRLLDGERRLRALKMRKVQTAACRVLTPMEASDESMMLMVGNSNRDELTEEEEARGVQQMMYLGVSAADAAVASGASVEDAEAMGTLVARLREREEKARAQNAVRNKPKWQMSFEDARAIEAVSDSEDDVAALLHAVENGDRAKFVCERDRIYARRHAAKRAEESFDAIEKAGAALVDWDEWREMEYGSDYTNWDGYKAIGKNGCGCDGFSASVDPSDGYTHWFCVKPENHKGQVEETDEQRADRERREAWEDAAAARREWLIDEISGIDGCARLNPWVQRHIVDAFAGRWEALALEGNPDGLPRDFRTTCLAIAFDGSSTSLSTLESGSIWNDAAMRRWLGMYDEFVRLGYVPSDIEADAARTSRDILERHEAGGGDGGGE